ncbi:class I SAM-dependent methyltransferase [uncultured Gimesia sp.]|uniref:class I SAM-dependent methyltransferase n=1 Tax=uncultured Gimesia sp. TaxID=1678688 RepID=UPI0030DB66F8|tara:strand:- start:23781 stop:24467 length:687 start_codon:yes stop_codon:yes gene_type:complete
MQNVKLLDDFHRQDVVRLLEGNENIGIELGVAQGIFSERMIESDRFSTFFGVDMYADTHDTEEYKGALKRVGLFAPYKLLRMTFTEALDLFDDHTFDFIYVDGYAHSGEEGGETMFQWYQKLKVGGVMAGDDYHEKWPLVMQSVNEFIRQTGGELMVTGKTEDMIHCQYPSWLTVKERDVELAPNQTMVKHGKSITRKLVRRRHFKIYLQNLLPDSVMETLEKVRRAA